MKLDSLEKRIPGAVDRTLQGLSMPPARQQRVFEYATGGRKMKRKLSVGLAVALILILLTGTAVAVALLSAREVIENNAVPLAQGNDQSWHVNDEYSAEELAELIRVCEANGVLPEEDSYTMRAFRNGEGAYEEEAIMDVCRQAFGGTYYDWTLEQRHWFEEIMIQIGFKGENPVALPGPEDLTEEEARGRMVAALREEFGDLPLDDRAQYHSAIFFEPEGSEMVWKLDCTTVEKPTRMVRAIMDQSGDILSLTDESWRYERPAQMEERAFRLTEEEAVALAAADIRSQTGQDVPLDDAEKYHHFTYKSAEGAAWEVRFISHTSQWGNCVAMVEDATGQVTVNQADVFGITADNALSRYRAEYGWWGEWTQEIWVKLAEEIKDKPAETLAGKVLKATPYIPERAGLLTCEQAEEVAYRAADLRHGATNSAVLIDAEPHPIWKFRLLPYDDTYPETILVEIDAVTGEKVDQVFYKSDNEALEPSWRMITLRRIWSRVSLQEEGPLPAAGIAVLHLYGDLAYDCPQDFLPIWDEAYWTPEITDYGVYFRALWSDLHDYIVTMDADGLVTAVEEAPSSGAEPMPDELPPWNG